MNRLVRTLFLVPLAGLACMHAQPSTPLRPDDVAADLRKAADWQLAHPSGVAITDWVIAPLYDGLLQAASILGEPAYLATVIDLGQQAGWSPRSRHNMADDYAVNKSWLEVYLMDPTRKERLIPSQATLDHIIAHSNTDVLRFTDIPRIHRNIVTSRWTWADALYMGPPTLINLYRATGDAKYLDFMDQEFRFCYEQLYDTEAKLFYRDNRYITEKSPSGHRIFWSRGNGWVYAGLAYVLQHLPAAHPTRPFYEKLFRDMSTAVISSQQPDGLWRPSMHDPAHIAVGETSGSSFFTYGLAWGINHGLLDPEAYTPVAQRAWQALHGQLLPDGRVGFVQPIGGSPEPVSRESIQDYGTGAFLMAGSEILQLLGTTPPLTSATLYAQAEFIIAERNAQPRAYARLVPERKDDLAWENDKVAFRVYGPALQDSVEDSGIDLWFKRVSHPIIDRWYALEHEKHISYHVDHGEGYDAYKVGDSRGNGGVALWVDDQAVNSNVYVTEDIFWTGPGELAFRTCHKYPTLFPPERKGPPVYEQRIVRLRLGERLNTIAVRYASNPRNANGGIITDFPYEAAIGLARQSPDATPIRDDERGIYGWHDTVDGQTLFTGVVIDPAIVVDAFIRPHPGEPAGSAHLWIKVRLDEKSAFQYRTGFAWAGDGDITTLEQWVDLLQKTEAPE